MIIINPISSPMPNLDRKVIILPRYYVINLEKRAIIKSPMSNLDRKIIILPIVCNKSGKESY